MLYELRLRFRLDWVYPNLLYLWLGLRLNDILWSTNLAWQLSLSEGWWSMISFTFLEIWVVIEDFDNNAPTTQLGLGLVIGLTTKLKKP